MLALILSLGSIEGFLFWATVVMTWQSRDPEVGWRTRQNSAVEAKSLRLALSVCSAIIGAIIGAKLGITTFSTGSQTL